MSTENSNKKQRVESPSKYLQPKIFTEEFQAELETQTSKGEPYNYGVIDGLFNEEILREARKQIFDNIQFTPKETDIYKLIQTGDLLNIDGLSEAEAKVLEAVHKVRDAIYSQEFRDVISRVTKCGPISAKKFDLSLNNYNKGCHLLTHDDVITTRVISFIIYLLPPDYEWDPKWGGALRLYPTLREGVPANDWVGAVPPKFNQLSFFKILPGRSFHDVEEVYVDQDRLSIQGWFHVPQRGEEGYQDKLPDQLKSTMIQQGMAHASVDGYEPKRIFAPFNEEPKFDLKKYINSDILENITKLNDEFVEGSMLKLENFLAPEFWKQVRSEIEELELQKCPQNTATTPKEWGVAGPPHIRKYLHLQQDAKLGALSELRDLFKSSEFAEFLAKLTSTIPESKFVELRRFRPGFDFTLASISGVPNDMLEATLSVTPAKFADDVGGYDLVMGGGDDENDDPAVYRQSEEDSVLLSEIPKANEFILIMRDPDLLRFVKYVSKNAHGSRWDVHGEYTIAQEEDEE